jgi:hypothetical protein
LQINAFLKLPAKKAENKTYMNQQLGATLQEMPSVLTGLLFMAHRNTSFVHK